MERPASPGAGARTQLALLAVAAAAVTAAYAFWPRGIQQRALLSHGSGAIIALLAAAITMRAARRPNAWRPTFAAGLALLAIGLAQTAGLALTMLDPPVQPYGGGIVVDGPFVAVAVLLLALYRAELVEHFPPEERREAVADITLLAVAGTAIVFLFLRPGTPGSAQDIFSSAVIALTTVAAIAAGGAVALREPSPVHLGLFAILTGFGVSSVAFAVEWLRSDYVAGHPLVKYAPKSRVQQSIHGLAQALYGKPVTAGDAKGSSKGWFFSRG